MLSRTCAQLSNTLCPAVVLARNYATKQQSKLWRQKPNRKPRLKIILAEDIPNLGVKGQIVEVKHGYGRNHLLPYKRAVYVTPRNIEQYNAFEVEEDDSSIPTSEKIKEYLADKTLIVKHDPNDESAIFEQHIAQAFHKSLSLFVPLECIELDEPITDFEMEHTVGVHVEDAVMVVPVMIERTLTEKKRRRVETLKRYKASMEIKPEVEGT